MRAIFVRSLIELIHREKGLQALNGENNITEKVAVNQNVGVDKIDKVTHNKKNQQLIHKEDWRMAAAESLILLAADHWRKTMSSSKNNFIDIGGSLISLVRSTDNFKMVFELKISTKDIMSVNLVIFLSFMEIPIPIVETSLLIPIEAVFYKVTNEFVTDRFFNSDNHGALTETFLSSDFSLIKSVLNDSHLPLLVEVGKRTGILFPMMLLLNVQHSPQTVYYSQNKFFVFQFNYFYFKYT